MKRILRACLQASISAMSNGAVALLLMLLMEFCISGNMQMYVPYVWAAGIISVLVFFIKLPRQLSDRPRKRYSPPKTASAKHSPTRFS